MEKILHYFPGINEQQKEQLHKLAPLYREWNTKINVISRKDMDAFEVRHVLHSLAIAKVMDFLPGAKVLDAGTGGGFPGIPLAILYPEARFHLVDSTAKKIRVIQDVAYQLGLKNVSAQHERVENLNQQYDFVVSRAVTAMPRFLEWVKPLIRKGGRHELKNGVLYLKGGDLSEELQGITHQLFALSDFFEEEFFDTKKIVFVKG